MAAWAPDIDDDDDDDGDYCAPAAANEDGMVEMVAFSQYLYICGRIFYKLMWKSTRVAKKTKE